MIWTSVERSGLNCFNFFVVQKEKDLELTARIGKELLTTQGLLESRVNSLEGELRSANDQITQLRHDLIIKTDLLQVKYILQS